MMTRTKKIHGVVLALAVLLGPSLLAGTTIAVPPKAPEFGPVIDAYAAYDPQNTCDPTAKPGVVGFRDIVLKAYPQTHDYGIVRACSADGTSEHKEGRAWDWRVDVDKDFKLDPDERLIAEEFIRWLLAPDRHGNPHAYARRFGVMYFVFNDCIYSAYRVDGKAPFEPRCGGRGHFDHVHFSFSWAGALKQTTWWKPCRSWNDCTPPTARITEPAEGEGLVWVWPVKAQASDSGTGVRIVSFWRSVNGGAWTKIDSDSVAPYETLDWACFVHKGARISYQAKAKDHAGNVGVSPIVTATVKADLCDLLVSIWPFDAKATEPPAEIAARVPDREEWPEG